MIISEKQLLCLIRFATLMTMPDYQFTEAGREYIDKLLNEIINQQSDELKFISDLKSWEEL